MFLRGAVSPRAHMPQSPLLNRFTLQFLFLPETNFLNIIFCSAAAILGRRDVGWGLTVCVLQSKSRHHDGSRSLCRGLRHGSSAGAFLVGVIFLAAPAGCAFAFFEGGSKEHELHEECGS